ncbi:MAG: hypothetical protein ACLGHP_05020, partial [Vicinamibacteria bacterium]
TRASAAFVQASPQVTPAAGSPGTWWIGASGLDALGGEAALARPGYLREVLVEGSRRARREAQATMERVRAAVGLQY